MVVLRKRGHGAVAGFIYLLFPPVAAVSTLVCVPSAAPPTGGQISSVSVQNSSALQTAESVCSAQEAAPFRRLREQKV